MARVARGVCSDTAREDETSPLHSGAGSPFIPPNRHVLESGDLHQLSEHHFLQTHPGRLGGNRFVLHLMTSPDRIRSSSCISMASPRDVAQMHAHLPGGPARKRRMRDLGPSPSVTPWGARGAGEVGNVVLSRIDDAVLLVQIDHRRLNIGVAQHALDLSDGRAMIPGQRGRGMAQRIGRNRADLGLGMRPPRGRPAADAPASSPEWPPRPRDGSRDAARHSSPSNDCCPAPAASRTADARGAGLGTAQSDAARMVPRGHASENTP